MQACCLYLQRQVVARHNDTKEFVVVYLPVKHVQELMTKQRMALQQYCTKAIRQYEAVTLATNQLQLNRRPSTFASCSSMTLREVYGGTEDMWRSQSGCGPLLPADLPQAPLISDVGTVPEFRTQQPECKRFVKHSIGVKSPQ